MNPFTDFSFKHLFGTKKNKLFLIDLLNQLLSRSDDPICDIIYQSTHFMTEQEDDRSAVFDVFCISDKNEHFIVEMQAYWQPNFKQRALYYSCFPLIKQAIKGEWDFYLEPVYCVTFLYNPKGKVWLNENELLIEAKLVNTKTKELYYNDLTYLTVQLNAFNKKEEECTSLLDKWLYILLNSDRIESVPESFKEPIFMKFFSESELAQMDKKRRSRYESSLKRYRDSVNTLAYAKKEGLQEGRAKGLQEGKLEGKQEIVKSLFKNGMSISQISSFTDISVSDIENMLE